MRSFGWSDCADPGGRRRASVMRSRAVLSRALIAPPLAGACETDKEAQRPPEQSQAQRDMRASSERLSEPLEGTMTEATTLGALLGGISVSIGGGNISSGIATGALYGGLAGRYVVTKQAKYSGDVEVLEATQEESQTLEARARAIAAEREALDRDIDEAARRLASWQERLASLSDQLGAAGQVQSDERKKLDEAQEKAKAAQERLGALRRGETQSLEAKRQDVGELQSLIAGVVLMVDALSN